MIKGTCQDPEGCTRPIIARGLCTKHYQRARASGMPTLPPRVIPKCSVGTCSEPAHANGLCNAHDKRMRIHGDVRADIPIQRQRRGRAELCTVSGCEGVYAANGLCMAHYMERFAAALKVQPCSVGDCQRPLLRRGLCAAHYWRWRKYGDPLAGGPFRTIRGTGNRWLYDEQRRSAKAKMSQVTGETAEYVAIIRNDPCVYCGAPCEHIDHIVPFADGGPTEWDNLAPACARHNHQKSRKQLLFFLLELVQEREKAA